MGFGQWCILIRPNGPSAGVAAAEVSWEMTELTGVHCGYNWHLDTHDTLLQSNTNANRNTHEKYIEIQKTSLGKTGKTGWNLDIHYGYNWQWIKISMTLYQFTHFSSEPVNFCTYSLHVCTTIVLNWYLYHDSWTPPHLFEHACPVEWKDFPEKKPFVLAVLNANITPLPPSLCTEFGQLFHFWFRPKNSLGRGCTLGKVKGVKNTLGRGFPPPIWAMPKIG